jgi:hypothetical protein
VVGGVNGVLGIHEGRHYRHRHYRHRHYR